MAQTRVGERLALVRKRLLDLGGVIPEGSDRTPAYLGEFVKKEVARWNPILKGDAK